MIGIVGNISGAQGNMQQNYWIEQGNLTQVNFSGHYHSFWGNKGETPIFSKEQGTMLPQGGPHENGCVVQ